MVSGQAVTPSWTMLHGFAAVWHRSLMTTTEERPAIEDVTDELPVLMTDTPIFDSVVRDMDLTPERWQKITEGLPPTKRQRHDAGRLTGKVWSVINSRNPHSAVIDGVEVKSAWPGEEEDEDER